MTAAGQRPHTHVPIPGRVATTRVLDEARPRSGHVGVHEDVLPGTVVTAIGASLIGAVPLAGGANCRGPLAPCASGKSSPPAARRGQPGPQIQPPTVFGPSEILAVSDGILAPS